MSKLKAYEKVVMAHDELDDGTLVINFDVTDDANIVTRIGGYVMARQDDDDKCFYVTVISGNGDVRSDTVVPFEFVGEPEEEV